MRRFFDLVDLPEPPALLWRHWYLAQIQGRANAPKLISSAAEKANPAARFLADVALLGSVTDPDTGALNPYYHTAEGQVLLKGAQDRITQQAQAAGGAATAVGAALLRFAAEVSPPRWAGGPAYVPTQEKLTADLARKARAAETAKAATIALATSMVEPIEGVVDNCMLGGNDKAGACGSAATGAVANLALGMLTDGVARRLTSLGVKVETSIDAGITWGKGIAGQGYPWEHYIAAQLPADARLPANFKRFDFFDEATGRAISAKTLDTSTSSRVTNPSQIYGTLKGYIDAAADFDGARLSAATITPDRITSREIYLAVPTATTSAQWEQIAKSAQ